MRPLVPRRGGPYPRLRRKRTLIVRTDDDAPVALALDPDRAKREPARARRNAAVRLLETMRVVTRTRVVAAAVCGAVLVAVTGSPGSAETLVERGAYLVTTVGSCCNRQTPPDAAGQPHWRLEV